jgi:insertion element IS1 protein InsB
LDQKKVAQLPPLDTTLLAPDPEDPTSTTLELDELWSFVLKKVKQVWVWIALCRKTRQVVAYAALVIGASRRVSGCGKPSHQPTVRDIASPTSGQRTRRSSLRSSTQPWARETGETAHVERWNNTLRQRLARFVRMTLSFSKSVVMHEACLLLFLHRYNEDRAILLK